MVTNNTNTIERELADIETSSDDYAARFAGETGQWMLEIQERIALDFLADAHGADVLDVGGGHGQLAIPLSREGYAVTVLGSDDSCRRRIASIVDEDKCVFEVGDVIDLPYADQSFEAVIAFRMLTHCGQWPRLVAELCRVAEKAVVVDYPTSQSLNRVAPALFKAKKRIEGNTRTWRLFRHREVVEEFSRNGFTLSRTQGQFFLPMVLHRALKSRSVSVSLENACRKAGLTAKWGSPVIVKMTRDA